MFGLVWPKCLNWNINNKYRNKGSRASLAIKIQNTLIRPSNAAKANIYISPPKCSFNLILTLRFKILNTDSLILILVRNNEKKPKLHVRHKNAILSGLCLERKCFCLISAGMMTKSQCNSSLSFAYPSFQLSKRSLD